MNTIHLFMRSTVAACSVAALFIAAVFSFAPSAHAQAVCNTGGTTTAEIRCYPNYIRVTVKSIPNVTYARSMTATYNGRTYSGTLSGQNASGGIRSGSGNITMPDNNGTGSVRISFCMPHLTIPSHGVICSSTSIGFRR